MDRFSTYRNCELILFYIFTESFVLCLSSLLESKLHEDKDFRLTFLSNGPLNRSASTGSGLWGIGNKLSLKKNNKTKYLLDKEIKKKKSSVLCQEKSASHADHLSTQCLKNFFDILWITEPFKRGQWI